MTNFTDEQKRFLVRHKISPNSLFDTSGMRSAEWMLIMEQEEKLFCFGAKPCGQSKDTPSPHTFRERKNHCIQCKTANISSMRRNVEDGFVYVTASTRLKMVKIGCSKDPDSRERTIKGFAYGGSDDWTKVAEVYFRKSAGAKEFEVHAKLDHFKSPQTYWANGHETKCSEIFACGYPTARRALVEVMGTEVGLKEQIGAKEKYMFADRSGG